MLQRLNLGEYFGQPLQRLRAHGILITENRFEANKLIGRHEHTYPHLTAVLRGGFDEEYDGQSFECRAGTVLVVPASTPHVDRVGSDGAHSLSIELSRGLSNRVSRESRLLTSPRVLYSSGVFAAARKVRAEFQRGSTASLTAIEYNVLGLLVAAMEESKSAPEIEGPEWLIPVLATLRAEPIQPPKLVDLARIAGVHPSHLSRVFRNKTGKTLPQFIAEQRLLRAAQLLTESPTKVGEIAAECGFADHSHFARTFYKRFDMTPAEFRCKR